MTTSTPTFNLARHVTETFVQVFETMLSLKATPATDQTVPHHVDRVTGSVGFAGEKVTGAVYIHLSLARAAQAASAMLGMPANELGEAEVNDVVGEVCNMVTGGLKSGLCDADMPCAMSTPAIIRGNSFHIEPMPSVQREVLLFDCEGDRIVVEIHIKFN